MKKITLIFLTAIILFACKEDEPKPPFNNMEFYENHEAANWTKDTAKEHLQGRWKLVYTYCCEMATNTDWVAVDDDYFALQFEGDSVKVFTNNNLEQTQYWEFDKQYEERLELETKDPISKTFGPIYFSKNYMLFHSSPADGPDNYFEKIE